MKNIGVDIDGVIVDTVEVYLQYIYKVTGRRFKQKDITEYFFEDCLAISREEVTKAVEMMFEEDIWDSIPFYDGALDALKKIGSEHNLYIITSRPPVAKKSTQAWIQKRGIPAEKTIFTDMDSKLDYIKEHDLELDCFIEDRLEFALEVAQEVPEVLLMDRPWNRRSVKKNSLNDCFLTTEGSAMFGEEPLKGNNSNGLVRVKNWAEIIERIFNDEPKK
ncbi:MAG: hypothetical protein U9R36_06625 [Elusimicrobiota bacterium]|nr:hypothetical protein [Elusimicrobiota bacterium]